MAHEPSERRNNKFNRRRLKTLQRRADFLADRPGSDKSESYDEAEYRALLWAIFALREWMAEDPNWVFVPNCSGHGGHWRKLASAYRDNGSGRWLIQPSADPQSIREATEAEIGEVLNAD